MARRASKGGGECSSCCRKAVFEWSGIGKYGPVTPSRGEKLEEVVGWWEGSPAILAVQLKVRFIYSELVGGRSQPIMLEALVAFHSTQLQYNNQFMKTLRLSF